MGRDHADLGNTAENYVFTVWLHLAPSSLFSIEDCAGGESGSVWSLKTRKVFLRSREADHNPIMFQCRSSSSFLPPITQTVNLLLLWLLFDWGLGSCRSAAGARSPVRTDSTFVPLVVVPSLQSPVSSSHGANINIFTQIFDNAGIVAWPGWLASADMEVERIEWSIWSH